MSNPLAVVADDTHTHRQTHALTHIKISDSYTIGPSGKNKLPIVLREKSENNCSLL